MPEKFRDSLNIPIAIPVWGLVCMIIGGVFTAGTTFQKLDQVIESAKKIDAIQERQINALATIRTHEATLTNHELRISSLERAK